MEIYISDEGLFLDKRPKLLATIKSVIMECLKEESVPYDVELSLTFVTKDEIRQINKEYREIDRPTDVLSFPQIDAADNGIINWENISMNKDINLDTNLLMLGDIIICNEIASEQAEEYGHSLEREICFLTAHSMFHLLGYDHMQKDEEELMVKKQEKVLNHLNIIR